MLPDTRGTRIFSQAFAWYFQAIAPLSFAYCSYRMLGIIGISRVPHLPKAFELWLLAETSFYLLIYLPMSIGVHGPAMSLAIPDRAKRHHLFNKCIATITDPVRYVSLWHRGAPIERIGREDVKEWICWAFMNKGNWDSDEDTELDQYVNNLEKLFADGLKFKEGHGTGVKTLRFSLDPVNLTHKPLLFYVLGVGGADIYAALVMWYNGYQHYATRQWFGSFPLRPQTLITTHRSAAQHISYWYRAHTSKTKLPILYIHGIGILHTYGDFFAESASRIDQDSDQDGQIGIIVLEILPISFRITHAALDPTDMRAEIQSILDQQKWSRFVLMANSYGTVISAQLLRSETLNTRIADVVLIDPVAFLLHLPDMAYNFTRRPPRSASEHQLYYFASTDIGAAHTLARRFSWTDSILWKEDLRGRRWTIILSEIDIIVAADAIGKYLTRPDGIMAMEDSRPDRDWKTTKWTGGALDVMWLEGLNHAEVFDTERDRKMVIDIAMNYSKGQSRSIQERPPGYSRWVEKSLLYKASPARFASTFGLDKTLEWDDKPRSGPIENTANGSSSKRHAS
jgi:pimeloyl-ACP methyl ester carboxylesterase